MILILTGPTACGKTSIAKTLAKLLPRSVVIDYDVVHNMFVCPHIPPWLPGGKEQQEIGVEVVSDIANRMMSDSYDVIITDVLSGHTTQLYRRFLKKNSSKIIQLLPDFPTLKSRFDLRGPCLTDEEFRAVYEEQKRFTEYDLRIDNSELSLEDTVQSIWKYTFS